MALYTILSALLAFFFTLAMDIFIVIPFFNSYTTTFFGTTLVISNLSYQVINVIGIVVLSLPIMLLLFMVIDTLNIIIWRVRL